MIFKQPLNTKIIYTFHYTPLFFINTAGYFFPGTQMPTNRGNLRTAVQGFTSLSLFKWSLFFLLLHNVFHFESSTIMGKLEREA